MIMCLTAQQTKAEMALGAMTETVHISLNSLAKTPIERK